MTDKPEPVIDEPVEADLEVFPPAPIEHRLDDKAAALEAEIQAVKTKADREKYLLIFVCITLFVCLVIPHLPEIAQYFLIIASIVFGIGAGKYLDFPWIVVPLERWHNLFFKFCERKMLGKRDDDENIEPM